MRTLFAFFLFLFSLSSLGIEYVGKLYRYPFGDKIPVHFGDYKDVPNSSQEEKLEFKYTYIQIKSSFFGPTRIYETRIDDPYEVYLDEDNFVIARAYLNDGLEKSNRFSVDYLHSAIDWEELSLLSDDSKEIGKREIKERLRFFLKNTTLDYTYHVSLIDSFQSKFKEAFMEVISEDYFEHILSPKITEPIPREKGLSRRSVLSGYFLHGKKFVNQYKDELKKIKVRDEELYDADVMQYKANLITLFSLLASVESCDERFGPKTDEFMKKYLNVIMSIGEADQSLTARILSTITSDFLLDCRYK